MKDAPGNEELPDHSGLARLCQCLASNGFHASEQIVGLCQAAGLVWGELYVDATTVEANAGIPSLIPRVDYEATTHVADLFEGDSDDAVAASR